jgi:hypothetical protein
MLRFAVLAALGAALITAAPASAHHHSIGATGRALVTLIQRRRRASGDQTPVARRQHPVALEA